MQVKNVAPIGQLSDADLRLLRVFKAVVDCGGMAAAELELNLAMSTISRHVKDLETRLGLVLCRRGRAGFALTPEGEQLYAATEQLLAATDAFRSSLHDVHRRLAGDLHVAVFEKTVSNPKARISQAVAAFRQQAPQVTLHMHVGTIAMIERGVIDGQYHLGIIPEHRRSDSLAYDPLFEETMYLYAGQGHAWFEDATARRGWADLRRQPSAPGVGYSFKYFQQVEGDVGQGHVFFERGALADQLAQLLGQDQGVVALAQQVLEFGVHRIGLHRAHRFLTSSGIGKKVGWR